MSQIRNLDIQTLYAVLIGHTYPLPLGIDLPLLRFEYEMTPIGSWCDDLISSWCCCPED